jgi:hypothetical protein
MGSAVVLLADRGRGGGPEAGLVRELTDTVRAVGRHHRALGHVGEAARIRSVVTPLQAIGVAAAAGAAVARVAQRAVEDERDTDRDWWDTEHDRDHDRDRDDGLER